MENLLRLYFLTITSLGYSVYKAETVHITTQVNFQNRQPEFPQTTAGSQVGHPLPLSVAL